MLVSVTGLCACGSEIPDGAYAITIGREDDTWARSPAVTEIDVVRVTGAGRQERVSRTKEPPELIHMGTSGRYWFAVEGLDEDGTLRAVGRSFSAESSEFAGAEIPLFVGRTDIFCRPPEGFAVAPGAFPPVAIVGGANLWVLGESDGEVVPTDGYSLLSWSELQPPAMLAALDCPNSSCRFDSFAVGGERYAIAIAGDKAIGIDSRDVYYAELQPPEGLDSWEDLAKGRTISGPRTTAFIVGATRDEAPTSGAALIDESGLVSAMPLNVARAGAAATWVDGRGLVVVGGSAEGAGVELAAVDTTSFVTLAYAPDPVTGAALLVEDERHLLRIGGRTDAGEPAPSVRLDLGCGTSCAPVLVPDLDLDIAHLVGFSNGTAHILVGQDEDDMTVAYRVTEETIESLELREPRQGASALALPTGHVALIGGLIPGKESSRSTLELVGF